HQGAVSVVAFSRDGRILATGCDDGTLRLWDPDKGQSLSELISAHPGGDLVLAISPDGLTLATGGKDGKVRFWGPAGQPRGQPIESHLGGVVAMAFRHDGRALATAGHDGMRLWVASYPGRGAAPGAPAGRTNP